MAHETLIDQLRAGLDALAYKPAPVYPASEWTATLALNAADIPGLTPFSYAQDTEFSAVKLFDLVTTGVIDTGVYYAVLTADSVKTALLLTNRALIVYGVIDDATAEKHILYVMSPPVHQNAL
jgi:hypothetical protein